ncbi:unnamed protein product, partial [Gordionus sp. m RMFG-2023]
MAITTDIWTSNILISFCALTVHYINDKWDLVNSLLSIVEFAQIHTGEDVKELIITILAEYKLIDKVSSISHDNGSNIVSAAKLIIPLIRETYKSNFNTIRSLAHIINIIVQEGLSPISTDMEKVELLVKKFHKSPSLMQDFVENCKCKIPLDVSTRWNSKYLMLNKINK